MLTTEAIIEELQQANDPESVKETLNEVFMEWVAFSEEMPEQANRERIAADFILVFEHLNRIIELRNQKKLKEPA
jgi:hypothetical protein